MEITITTTTLYTALTVLMWMAGLAYGAYQLRLAKRLNDEARAERTLNQQLLDDAHKMKADVEARARAEEEELERRKAHWRLLPPEYKERSVDSQVIVPVLTELSRLEGDKLQGAVVMVGLQEDVQLRFYCPGVTQNMAAEAYMAGPHRTMLRMVAKAMANAERAHAGSLDVLMGMLDEQVLLMKDTNKK